MASNTPNLGLHKKDPVTDGNQTFNIQTMLNDNWDKIDLFAHEVEQKLTEISNVDEEVNKLIQQIGDLPTLSTENKLNLVAAVNEVYQKIVTHSAEKATTTGYGHTILNPTLTSTSHNEAATAGAAKAANDNANSRIPSNMINKPNGVLGLDSEGKIPTSLRPPQSVEAGDTNIYSNSTELSTPSNTPVKVFEVTTNVEGSLRIKFEIRGFNASDPAYCQVFRNGIAVGILRINDTNPTTYTSYVEDIGGWKVGDKVQFYLYGPYTGGTYTTYLRNINISIKGEIS
ncbi:tail fiber protein [Cytobacillus praedii]|uniref:tail fiber protein n=1 Tax=Cytobacillus praedii TaxID=1742358 RepID=UPI002E1B95E5|nr:tail fiber protein [Cytobacillus praedii]MED3549950.1 tail fiber protein [Cytobacillus praedii]